MAHEPDFSADAEPAAEPTKAQLRLFSIILLQR